MSSLIKRFRPWLEPFAAVIFVVFWIMAEAGRYHLWGDIALLLGFGAALGISWIAPAWSVAGIGALLLLQFARIAPLPDSTTWPVYLSILGVAFVAGQLPREREVVRWVALACGAPFAVLVALLMAVPAAGEGVRWTSWVGDPSSGTWIASAFINIAVISFAFYLGAWAVGYVGRLNSMRLHSLFLLQHTARDLALAETELHNGRDRDWIAQEVHDLLAHSLAVVTAQADGARLSPNTDAAGKDEALLAISGAAREALVDMQALVEALRENPTGAPQPTLAELAALLDRLSSAGMQVDVVHFGDAKGLTPARELAVFRILQESLTNSLRHAGSQHPARVAFDWRGPGLALSISTARAAGGRNSVAGGLVDDARPAGHGIRGMKDRARLAGGWLTAGQVEDDDASFIVAAFFPTEESMHAPESVDAPGNALQLVTVAPTLGDATRDDAPGASADDAPSGGAEGSAQ
jgi:signal transduction histidine kinase